MFWRKKQEEAAAAPSQEITAHQIAAALVFAGVDAFAHHTGGGVFVCEFPLDVTSRDHQSVVWVTHEDDYFLIGFYNVQDEDETFEAAAVELHPYTFRGDPLPQLVEWVQNFARVTGLVLP